MEVQQTRRPYLFKKRGIFYFQRRVPKRLQSYYSVDRVTTSLRTRSLEIASKRALGLAASLDEYWFGLGVKKGLIASSGFLAADSVKTGPKLRLRDVMSLYLNRRGEGRPSTFRGAVLRSFEYFRASCGDKDLYLYSREDALKIRDDLLGRGLAPQSVRRVVSTLRGAVNLAINEYCLDQKNIFSNLDFGVTERRRLRATFGTNELNKLVSLCVERDDQRRWIIALIVDTGMRLAEVVGLHVEDIRLDAEIPHIDLRPHLWRPLKTGASKRLIPLAGASLWAATRVVSSGTKFAFSDYCRDTCCSSNSASAAINKWMKEEGFSPGQVIHSLRHTFRDRLRAEECPSDIVDQLGGWATAGVGQAYGVGYPLPVLQKWIKKICLKREL
jgi:integrase